MAENPYAAPATEAANYKSPLPLLKLSQPIVRLSGEVPKDTALKNFAECKLITGDTAKSKSGYFKYAWVVLGLVVAAAQLILSFYATPAGNATPATSSGSSWIPVVGAPLFILCALLPWIILYREGKASQHPEKVEPPMWAAVEIELHQDGYRLKRRGEDGVTRYSMVDWKWTTASQSEEVWIFGTMRTSVVQIPRNWVQSEEDCKSLDEFFLALATWQKEPGNIAMSVTSPLPDGWAEMGIPFELTGGMEYALSPKITAEVRKSLPKFEHVSPTMCWCRFTWLAIFVVTIVLSVGVALIDSLESASWFFFLWPGGLLSLFSYFLLRRSLNNSRVSGLISPDSLRLAYEGNQHQMFLSDLPSRLLVRESVVVSNEDGSFALALPKQAFKDEADWQEACQQLGVL